MKIVSISDIHVGNPKINLSRLVDSLHEYAWPEFETAQIILIGGDFFDCLLNMNSDAGIMAIYIIDELINLAVTKNIYLRVLRGTFSHDRYQNRLFVERSRNIPSYNGSPLVRVIDKIEIERFGLYNIDILFCPDDQPQKDVTEALIDTLNSNHLEQVDYMCCHGYWDHLLPPNTPVRPHDCLDYDKVKDRVRYQIFNGHVHSPGRWQKVISNGSFERFKHAEEEDKGFFVAELDEAKKESVVRFVRNKRATPFITVDLNIETTPEKALDYLDKRIKQELKYYDTNDETVHVRLVGDGSAIIPLIKDKYAKAIVTEKHASAQRQVDTEFNNSINDLPTITVENLPKLIFENIKDKHPELTLERIKEILDDTGV